MYSAEVLSQLRSLNWLTQEIHRVPSGSREAALLQNQLDGVRARLPDSILEYHDQLAARGRQTAAEMLGDACGSCGTKLPPELCNALNLPGHFGICPKCGLFLWAATKDSERTEGMAKRPALKGAS